MMRACVDCGRPSPGTRCADHEQKHRRRRYSTKRDRGLYSTAWRKLRLRVLERDQHRCRLELPGCTGRATSVHIDPRFGGDHRNLTEADCVSACHPCHGATDAPRAHERAGTGGRGMART